MKIDKVINVQLKFIETQADCFLGSAIYDYICEMDDNLKDNIALSENEDNNNLDFLYSYNTDSLEIKSKIEDHIAKFEKKFNLVESLLTQKIDSGEICDSNEFYEQFKDLSAINLDESVDDKTKFSTKRKI